MQELFLGTVSDFKKQRGYGNIVPDDKADFGDKVFCHWKTIQTSDKWPTLKEGMRVAFLAERDAKKQGWKTIEVYTEDGGEINLDNEIVLFNNGKKYKGVCLSYNKGKGTGLIKPDGNGPWPKTGVKVLRSDIDGDGSTPFLKKGQRVQLQLTKDKEGYRAVNITLPNGGKIPTGGASKKKKEESENPAQRKAEKPTRKRQLSQASKNKNSPAKKQNNAGAKKNNAGAKKNNTGSKKNNTGSKKNNTGANKQFKRAQIESGTYGGMEVDVEDKIEVGVLLKSHWVGSLIGKKGATIREIQKLSDADMKFGDDDIQVEGALYKVFAVAGKMNQVADACKVVAVKLGEASQSLEYKIVFLVPDAYCGMFVGKKGATINEIRGGMDLRVRVVLSQEPVQLPGSSMVTLCTVFGPRENVKDAIERTVAVLGGISNKLKQQMAQPPQWEDKSWDRGFRGNPRESAGWGRGGRGGNGGGWGQDARRGGNSGWGQEVRRGGQATRAGGRRW